MSEEGLYGQHEGGYRRVMDDVKSVRPETRIDIAEVGNANRDGDRQDGGVDGASDGASGGKSKKRGRPRKDHSRDSADSSRTSSGEKEKSAREILERVEPEIVPVHQVEDNTVIPKQKKVKKQSKKSSITTKDNLQAIFSLLSNFAGSVWELSEEECERLAEPLDSILARHDFFEKISKHSDVVALCLSSLVIFTPRVLMTIELTKDAKRRNRDNERKEKQTEKTDTTSSPSDSSDVSADIKNYLADLY